MERNPVNSRRLKGLKLALGKKITSTPKGWQVPSQTKNHIYLVRHGRKGYDCNCRDYYAYGRKCKHIFAVEYMLGWNAKLNNQGEALKLFEDSKKALARTTPKVYRQNWPAYNNAQVYEKELFQILLRDLCRDITEPQLVGGRPPLPVKDRVFSMAFKVYSTFSSRRFSTDLRDAYEKEYLSKLPHYNSVIRYFDDPRLTLLLKELVVQSSLPLKTVEQDFSSDSSGLATLKYLRWQDEKHGAQSSRDWVKVHLMCGVKTNIVTSVDISGSYEHDSPFFKGLVKTTAQNFNVSEVSADKGYSSRKNLALIASLGATPYVPFKSSARQSEPRTEEQRLWNELLRYYIDHHDQFLIHYHKRSNAESTFSMIKRKYGETLRTKNYSAQVNEALCKVLCHNISVLIHSMFELGIDPMNFWGSQ